MICPHCGTRLVRHTDLGASVVTDRCPNCRAEQKPIPLSDEIIKNDQHISQFVFAKYNEQYHGEVQGCCPLIADEIQKRIGGTVVAGEITWYSGSCRRTHWWVIKDGIVYDPMGDDILKHEQCPGREEHHRSKHIFKAALEGCEQWRIELGDPAAEKAKQGARQACNRYFKRQRGND